jgi:hypothetical protein
MDDGKSNQLLGIPAAQQCHHSQSVMRAGLYTISPTHSKKLVTTRSYLRSYFPPTHFQPECQISQIDPLPAYPPHSEEMCKLT